MHQLVNKYDFGKLEINLCGKKCCAIFCPVSSRKFDERNPNVQKVYSCTDRRKVLTVNLMCG